MGARAPFSSFTLPQTASEEKRQLSEQAVIPERNPTTLDRSTPADFTELVPPSKPGSLPVMTDNPGTISPCNLQAGFLLDDL